MNGDFLGKLLARMRIILIIFFYLCLLMFPFLFAKNVYSTFQSENEINRKIDDYKQEMKNVKEMNYLECYETLKYLEEWYSGLTFDCMEITMKAFLAFLLSALYSFRRIIKIGTI